MRAAPSPAEGSAERHRLRILALGRIPRCRRCPRYLALAGRTAGTATGRALPGVPDACRLPVCLSLRDDPRHAA